MYYRDASLNLYKILCETDTLFICEGLNGESCPIGRIVNFHKFSGKMC